MSLDPNPHSIGDAPSLGDGFGVSPRGPAPGASGGRSVGDAPSLVGGASAPGQPPLLPARGYEVQSVLGRGGMGVVYLARQPRLDRLVAIKRLLADQGLGEKGVARLLREAKVVAQLQHPNIVAIHELNEDEHGPFIVMEYVRGGSLLDLIHAEGKLEEARALELIQGVCRGVAHAHKKDVLHRDIKPGNVLLTEEDGGPKVVDFGLARAVEGSELSVAGQALGTLFYMAPEQRRDASSVDARADVYAIGKTLYHLVTGKLPETIRLHKLSPGLADVLERALEEDPADRHGSVVELLEALEEVRAARGLPSARRAARRRGAPAEPGDCQACSAQNPDAARFCQSCGAALFLPCPGCQGEVRVGAAFCLQCGFNLQARAEAEGLLARGKEAHAACDFESALELAKEASALDAALPGAQALAEDAQDKKRQLDQARALAQQLLGADGFRQQDYEQARLALDSALAITPRDEALLELRRRVQQGAFEWRLGQALTQRKAGDYARALAGLKAAAEFKDVPDHAQAQAEATELGRRLDQCAKLLERGGRALRAARPAEAFEAGQEIQEILPGESAGADLLVKAREVRQRAAGLVDHAKALADKGKLCAASGALTRAAELDREAPDLASLARGIEARRTSASARLARAQDAEVARDFAAANQLAAEALALDQGLSDAATLQCQAQEHLATLEEARGLASRLLASAAFDPEAFQRARATLRIATGLAPRDTTLSDLAAQVEERGFAWRAERAKELQRAGRHEEALAHLEQAAKLSASGRVDAAAQAEDLRSRLARQVDLLAEGREALKTARLAHATEVARQAHDLLPGDAKAGALLAEVEAAQAKVASYLDGARAALRAEQLDGVEPKLKLAASFDRETPELAGLRSALASARARRTKRRALTGLALVLALTATTLGVLAKQSREDLARAHEHLKAGEANEARRSLFDARQPVGWFVLQGDAAAVEVGASQIDEDAKAFEAAKAAGTPRAVEDYMAGAEGRRWHTEEASALRERLVGARGAALSKAKEAEGRRRWSEAVSAYEDAERLGAAVERELREARTQQRQQALSRATAAEGRRRWSEAVSAYEEAERLGAAVERELREACTQQRQQQRQQQRRQALSRATAAEERRRWSEAVSAYEEAERLGEAVERKLTEVRKQQQQQRQQALSRAAAAEERGDWVAAVSAYEEAKRLGASVDAKLNLLRPNARKQAALKKAGFAFLRKEAFSLGGQRHEVEVYRCEAFAKALGLSAGATDIACEFVRVPGGTFRMGSPSGEANRGSDEGPVHRVTLEPFLVARTEVTQAVWRGVMGNTPSDFSGVRLPVEQVSWYDVVSFCEKTGLRLPSEAEWEYACRAGTTTPFAFGRTITPSQVNYDGNYPYGGAAKGTYRKRTTDVGSFAANAFGLFDVHGNVWEWCQDTYQSGYSGAPSNGSAWQKAGASERVFRGGSWDNFARLCRSACRDGRAPGYRSQCLGFRPARSYR